MPGADEALHKCEFPPVSPFSTESCSEPVHSRVCPPAWGQGEFSGCEVGEWSRGNRAFPPNLKSFTCDLTHLIPKLDRQKKKIEVKFIFSKAFYSSHCLRRLLPFQRRAIMTPNSHYPAQLSQGPRCRGSGGSKTKKYWEICPFWATNLTYVGRELGFHVIE